MNLDDPPFDFSRCAGQLVPPQRKAPQGGKDGIKNFMQQIIENGKNTDYNYR